MAHKHYKGTGQMHSFRGLLANGDQDKIRIEGATGESAWRITKFSMLPGSPDTNTESTVKIYRERQTSLVATIDLSEDELLAAGIFTQKDDSSNSVEHYVIFDNALFVRNIYISTVGVSYAASINYYIELEEVKVSAVGMAQLAVAAARRNRFTSE